MRSIDTSTEGDVLARLSLSRAITWNSRFGVYIGKVILLCFVVKFTIFFTTACSHLRSASKSFSCQAVFVPRYHLGFGVWGLVLSPGVQSLGVSAITWGAGFGDWGLGVREPSSTRRFSPSPTANIIHRRQDGYIVLGGTFYNPIVKLSRKSLVE